MTGFGVNPEGLDQHATQVDALGKDVGNGAAGEVAGTAQANFGVLIGNTLGRGITELSDHFSGGLTAAATAIDATAMQLHSTAAVYRVVEEGLRVHLTGLRSET